MTVSENPDLNTVTLSVYSLIPDYNKARANVVKLLNKYGGSSLQISRISDEGVYPFEVSASSEEPENIRKLFEAHIHPDFKGFGAMATIERTFVDTLKPTDPTHSREL